MEKTKVILADDHNILRYGLRLYLMRTDDIEIVGEAATGKECIRLFKEKNPDICVIDIEMPEKTGIEVVREIRKMDKDVKLIILSMHSDEQTLQKALSAGVNGYLLKDLSKKEILSAIRAVANDQQIISDAIRTSASQEKTEKTRGAVPDDINITDREMEVIKLVVAGYSSSQIAEKLYISRRTVDTHRNNIMQKLDIHNTASLVRFAMQNNLVEVSQKEG